MIQLEYDIRHSRCPLLALAVHNGHQTLPALADLFLIDEFTRLREEDPCTGVLAKVSPNYLIVDSSRFQTDVNRSAAEALYRTPEEAWGLQVRGTDLPPELEQELREDYDRFYQLTDQFVKALIRSCGYLVIYDFHSYNYRRDAGGQEADPELNPEINIGTGNMNRRLWEPVIAGFREQLIRHDYFGRSLDVRENIKFKGGFLSRWIHERYPDHSCVLAIEVKKFFMDEWTGAIDILRLQELKKAFLATVPTVLKEAESIGRRQRADLTGEDGTELF